MINIVLFSCTIEITEGRNRQVRKMIEAINNRVITLIRVKFANITLSNLKEGEWTHLNAEELMLMKPYIDRDH